MGSILPFPSREMTIGRRRVVKDAPAAVIIFPGVRYEASRGRPLAGVPTLVLSELRVDKPSQDVRPRDPAWR